MDLDDRRQTYAVLPSTVKKPQLEMKRQKIEEDAEEEEEVKDDTLKQAEPEMVTEEKTETDIKNYPTSKKKRAPRPARFQQILNSFCKFQTLICL